MAKKNELTKNEEITLESLERCAEESKAEGELPLASRNDVMQYCCKGGKMASISDVETALYGLFLKGKALKFTCQRGGDNLLDGPFELWAPADVLVY